MDQLKQQLAVVLKYGFWIGSAIVLLGSLGAWYMTTSKLATESESQTSKLEQSYQAVTSVRSSLSEQPNDLSHEKMGILIEERKKEVLESWKSLYDRQRSILTWPTKELTQEFVDEFKDMIPIEVHVDFPTLEADEKESYLRTQYQRYIGNALPDIAAIANAEWSAEFSRAGTTMGMGTSRGATDPYMGMGNRRAVSITGNDSGPLVKWSSTSQQALLDDLFPWRGNGTPPTTLEVYYSQENLWILKQLLQIISNVNGDARQPYEARIHDIIRIGIGESVSFTAGQISKPGEGLSGGGGMEDMMDSMMGMDMESMGDSMGMTSSTTAAPDPGDNRYVNTKNEPITGSALRSALKSNSASDAEIAVAKRVPVMMSLQIDQRSIQQLLAECGSAPLMVEVSQVRVLPKSGVSSLGGGMGDMGMEEESGMETEMDMGMGMGMGMGATAPIKKPAEEFPLDMSVEIYGLIYMYNPPDPVKLGVEQVDKNTVLEGATETTPAATAVPVAPAPPAESNDGVLPDPASKPAQQPGDTVSEPPVAGVSTPATPPAIAIGQP